MQFDSVEHFDHDAHLVRELKKVGLKAGIPSKKFPYKKEQDWDKNPTHQKIHIKGKGENQ